MVGRLWWWNQLQEIVLNEKGEVGGCGRRGESCEQKLFGTTHPKKYAQGSEHDSRKDSTCHSVGRESMNTSIVSALHMLLDIE